MYCRTTAKSHSGWNKKWWKKNIFYVSSPSVIYPKKKKKKVAAKGLYRASLLNRILLHSMEQREDSCVVPLHPGLNTNLLFCAIRTEENMFFPLSYFLQRIDWGLLRLCEGLFLRNSNSKGAQGHPKDKLQIEKYNTLCMQTITK